MLQEYWQVFDRIHAAQQIGMSSLWGLAEEHESISFDIGPIDYRPRLYRELLPDALLTKIQRLWGTAMLARWPQRLVTNVFPHSSMMATLGPALAFWQGVALTAWFICEGPMSRTDIPGMEEHYRYLLGPLEECHTPVNSQLFEGLTSAGQRLGLTQSHEGTSHTTSIGIHERPPDGFKILRDIITEHRRTWAQKHLVTYLRTRWESEIGAADRIFKTFVADAGRSPSAKQFSRDVAFAVNHWFGGDIGRLCEAIGEKPYLPPTYRPVIPHLVGDPDEFGACVLSALLKTEPNHGQDRTRERDRQNAMRNFAGRYPLYFQIEEALGQRPQFRDFTYFHRNEWMMELFDLDGEALWQWFSQAVETVRDQEREGPMSINFPGSARGLLQSQPD